MNPDSEQNFADFLSEQVKVVREAVETPLELNSERYSHPELIGEGAQKRIYRVRDEACSRQVAMAVLRDTGEVTRARFIREARVTALLEHPNIMPVYDHGIDENDLPFFTMRLCNGRTLAELIAPESETSLAERLNALVKICEALSYAHSRGILHRDLKPDNVQVGDFGEVLLSDWGLALVQYEDCDEELLRDETLSVIDLKVSLQGDIKGTPGYVAPEILHSPTAFTPASDIFALGSILHILLTGRLPVEGTSADTILKNTREGRIRAFQNLDQTVPEGLVAIGNKALAIDPQDRYTTVSSFLADLQRFLNGFATRAENAGLKTQLALFYRRNTSACNTAVAFAALVGLIISFAIHTLREKENYASGLVDDLVAANTARTRAEQELAPLYVERARDAFLGDDLASALALAEVAHNYSPDSDRSKLILGKTLLARQEFARAAEVLNGINSELEALAKKFAELKTGPRLSHDDLMLFLKEVGTRPGDDRSFIYRNVLFEEFQISTSPKEQIDLIRAEILYRNETLSEVHLEMSIDGNGAYLIDLSHNPDLVNAYIFEKLGPVKVHRLDISQTSIRSLDRFTQMTIDTLIMRDTPALRINIPIQEIRHLDAEGSSADLSIALEDSQAEFLNIHNSGFRRYGVLLSMPRLKTLIVSRGKLPADIRAGLPETCEIIEK